MDVWAFRPKNGRFREVAASGGLTQGLQILLMSVVSMTSASQIFESFWNIWSQVSQRKKPFSHFPARGPSMYVLQLIFLFQVIFVFPLFQNH